MSPTTIEQIARDVDKAHESGERCADCGETRCSTWEWAKHVIRTEGLSHPLT